MMSPPSAPQLPDIPVLPLPPIRAATSHGMRLTRFPTPQSSARMPSVHVVRPPIDLHLPQTRPGSTVTGLVSMHNAFGANVWELLNRQDRAADRGDDDAGEPTSASKARLLEWERQRDKRMVAANRALSDINQMTLERKALRRAAECRRSTAPRRRGRAKAEAEPAEAKRAHHHSSHQRAAKSAASMAKSASGRVAMRLSALREDEAARAELSSRVDAWKQARTDGSAETRNFVVENRRKLPSQAELLEQRKRRRRGGRASGWGWWSGSARSRRSASSSAPPSTSRSAARPMRPPYAPRRARRRCGAPVSDGARRRGGAAAGGAGADERAGAAGERRADQRDAPARAQLLRLELERRRRWAMMVALAMHTSHLMDELVLARTTATWMRSARRRRG